jgi:hypothetical protein
MDDELLSALHALAAELVIPVRRSHDEWVRGHNAGTATAGRRLQDVLDKHAAARRAAGTRAA